MVAAASVSAVVMFGAAIYTGFQISEGKKVDLGALFTTLCRCEIIPGRSPAHPPKLHYSQRWGSNSIVAEKKIPISYLKTSKNRT